MRKQSRVSVARMSIVLIALVLAACAAHETKQVKSEVKTSVPVTTAKGERVPVYTLSGEQTTKQAEEKIPTPVMASAEADREAYLARAGREITELSARLDQMRNAATAHRKYLGEAQRRVRRIDRVQGELGDARRDLEILRTSPPGRTYDADRARLDRRLAKASEDVDHLAAE